eukprot:CAMPEP_0204821080 /NCGR_PEP_ID=MMETSP1018-20131115/2216_1 /ASSEMBLY_ACC=CAM_ASM_000518 /TAXON_ID=46462 /ORGANISM="Anophryoides haemophila, Strain AH6" /LENGTH=89 /DNA_ID=CAMNT_0051919677 /DNA_START=1195 /DNA_END=1464 /DNA_ORIENTATION=+
MENLMDKENKSNSEYYTMDLSSTDYSKDKENSNILTELFSKDTLKKTNITDKDLYPNITELPLKVSSNSVFYTTEPLNTLLESYIKELF